MNKDITLKLPGIGTHLEATVDVISEGGIAFGAVHTFKTITSAGHHILFAAFGEMLAEFSGAEIGRLIDVHREIKAHADKGEVS